MVLLRTRFTEESLVGCISIGPGMAVCVHQIKNWAAKESTLVTTQFQEHIWRWLQARARKTPTVPKQATIPQKKGSPAKISKLSAAKSNNRNPASDFRVDGAKSPEIPQKETALGSEIAARNRKALATFHRTLKSQCSTTFSCLGNRCDFSGPRWASQSQIAKVAAISVR